MEWDRPEQVVLSPEFRLPLAVWEEQVPLSFWPKLPWVLEQALLTEHQRLEGLTGDCRHCCHFA